MPLPTIMCMYHNCNRPATCLPRVYVPPSVLSANQDAKDVSTLCGMPLCDTCFKKISAKELLDGERGEQIRSAAIRVMRERSAFPNFDKAVVGRVSQHDQDWQRYLKMRERHRAN